MARRISQMAKLLIGVWMAGVIFAMFLIIPHYEGLGDAGRIIIMHVPTAWVSVLAFAVSAFYSGMYLWRRRPSDDDRAVAAAECGFLFTVLATVTGAIFSQVVWGIYWNWDPRQTSIFVLLLVYAALFALRAAIDPMERRRRLGAVYSLFAFVTVPFLVFIAPRLADSTLHPNCAFLPGSQCDGIVLSEGRIGLLGDRKIQLLALNQQGDIITAAVEVSEPGLTSSAILEPTFSLAQGRSLDEPNFPAVRFRLALEHVDLEAGNARLNIHAPGTGMIDNPRTFFTFMASNLGFTMLFVWMLQMRSTLLGASWKLEEREGALI